MATGDNDNISTHADNASAIVSESEEVNDFDEDSNFQRPSMLMANVSGTIVTHLETNRMM